MFWDSTMIVLIPAIFLTLYAQYKVNKAYSNYKRIPIQKNDTGQVIARKILDHHGMTDICIEKIQGILSDHYDPRDRTLRLSEDVYAGKSVAAAAIAAHEVGHAIQHNQGYQALAFRNSIVPVVNLASGISGLLIIGGLMISALRGLLDIGIILFSFTVIFQLITLPVEFNASTRALQQLDDLKLLTRDEIPMGKDVLDAAALTYVAAASSSILSLVRLVILRNRQD